jgi:hypothetical protein
MMSDSKNSPVDGGAAGKPAAPGKDQPVPFTYPDGFNAVANSLHFLPEEARVQTLTGLVLGIVAM